MTDYFQSVNDRVTELITISEITEMDFSFDMRNV